MAIKLTDIVKGRTDKAPTIFLYAVGGIGKSTWASHSPNPIFIDTEDGTDRLDVARIPVKSYLQVVEALDLLLNEKHDYQTVVVDTVDWLERIIHAKVASDHDKRDISEIGYGKGPEHALFYWQQLIEKFRLLREKKNLGLILIAHSLVKTYTPPEREAFDRYRPAIHEKAERVLTEWVDNLFFANYVMPEFVKNKAAAATAERERVLYTEERPAFLAKNRYGLPAELKFNPLDWSEFLEAMNGGKKRSANINK